MSYLPAALRGKPRERVREPPPPAMPLALAVG